MILRPALFTIPATVSFVDALAAGLLKQAGGDPAALSAMTVLVPNRRAVRSLRDAFLRKSNGTPLLLPTIRPVGDVAEDELLLGGVDLSATDIPPAIDPFRRQIILAQYLNATQGHRFTVAQGLATAAALGRLIDSVHTEGLTLDGLDTLVAQDYAEHWKISLDFLNDVLRVHWPQHLASEGAIDPALRRRLMIEAYTQHLQDNPPVTPIIGAGSTGSIPATAQLLKTIAYLPTGNVVLPGLDLNLDDTAWDAVTEGHPQYVMKNLLAIMDALRTDVRLWPDTMQTDARQSLISEIMRPAETTAVWTSLETQDGFDNLMLLEADTLDQEAASIALMMRRHAQDETDSRLVLVTPDRILAGRVGLHLRRWGIIVDDSAGVPLSHTPVGSWLLDLAATWADQFAPVPLLATLKHALTGGGPQAPHWRNFVRDLDHYVLRGVRPAPGIDGLFQRLDNIRLRDETVRSALREGLNNLRGLFTPMLLDRRGTQAHLRALIATAENLAATPEMPGAMRLWSGDDGEAAATMLAALLEQGDVLPDLHCRDLVDLLRAAMSGITVRPRFGTHPRLAILGPIEARLYQADTMILGSLNEGTWPALAEVDGWMSRPMRRDFKLPAPERAITLSAHDFCQGLGAPNIIITRSRNRDGAPTTPARWLQRLDAVIDAVKARDIRTGADQWLSMAQSLDLPDTYARPAARPVANPPVDVRFESLSVTDIATLLKDPYGIYARHTLSLRAWDPIDAEPGPKDRGNLIHKVLENFARAHSETWPDDAYTLMLATGRDVFAAAGDHPDVLGHWWPRFERMARALCNHEAMWRQATKRVFTEVQAKHRLDIGGRAVMLTGRADRVESRTGSGWAVIDYKSGTVPAKSQVTGGMEPQLTLLGAMLRAGCFNEKLENSGAYTLETLSYWPVGGSRDVFKSTDITDDPDTLSDQSLKNLIDLLARYLVEGIPFESWPDMSRLPRDNAYDYAHLERMAEWRNDSSEDDEGEAA